MLKQVVLAHFEPVGARFGPRKIPKCLYICVILSNTAKIKRLLYFGLCGSKPTSEGTYCTRNPPLFVISKPQNRPRRSLHPQTSGHFV